MTDCYVLSGCSGGGKSTLIEALRHRGWSVVPEAGRQIVQSEMASSGQAFPWDNPIKFTELAAQLSAKQIEEAIIASKADVIITDRSIVDLVSYLGCLALHVPQTVTDMLHAQSYARTVFITPPWPEIFESDVERPKDFAQAVQEYEVLRAEYLNLGYGLIDIPKVSVLERAKFIEEYFK